MRETELSAASYSVYRDRFDLDKLDKRSADLHKKKLPPSQLGKKRSWLGMVRLPDRQVKGGQMLPSTERSVKWPGVFNETEVYDPSDPNGLTTIIKRVMKGVPPPSPFIALLMMVVSPLPPSSRAASRPSRLLRLPDFLPLPVLAEVPTKDKEAILEYMRNSSRHRGVRIGQLGPHHPAYAGPEYPSFCMLAAERIEGVACHPLLPSEIPLLSSEILNSKTL